VLYDGLDAQYERAGMVSVGANHWARVYDFSPADIGGASTSSDPTRDGAAHIIARDRTRTLTRPLPSLLLLLCSETPNYSLVEVDSTAAPVEELLPVIADDADADGSSSGVAGGGESRRAVGVQVVTHRSRLAATRLASDSESAGDLAALRMRSLITASVFGQRLRLKASAARRAKQANDPASLILRFAAAAAADHGWHELHEMVRRGAQQLHHEGATIEALHAEFVPRVEHHVRSTTSPPLEATTEATTGGHHWRPPLEATRRSPLEATTRHGAHESPRVCVSSPLCSSAGCATRPH
jgi:hypothetical protein